MEQKHEGQQDQRDGEGGECQVNNPLLYFHHCNKGAQSYDDYCHFLNTFLFRFSGRVGDFMGYLDPITKIYFIMRIRTMRLLKESYNSWKFSNKTELFPNVIV